MNLTSKPLNAIDLELISNKELESMISCYVCINCKKVPLNPQKCCNPKCSAFFCDGCFKINNDSCPGCYTKNSKKPISKELEQLFSILKFECVHKNEGCQSLISLSNYQDHLNFSKCEFLKESPNNHINTQLKINANENSKIPIQGKILLI